MVLGGESVLGGMGEKEIRRAVEITEEKLQVLKEAVGSGNAKEQTKGKSEP